MKVNARQDIEASAADVFQMLADFARWERDALRRGAGVQRTDRLEAPGVGTAWLVDFDWRGTARKVALTVTGFDPGAGLALSMDAGSLAGNALFDLVALSPRRTRLTLKTEITAKSMLGKVLMQTLRLGKKQIEERLQSRLASLAHICEERARPATGR
jgi:hypothetical protein